MRPHHYTYIVCSIFLVTIFFLQWHQKATYPVILWVTLGLCAVCGICFTNRTQGRVLLSVSFGIILALFSISRTTHIPSAHSIDTYATGQEVTLYGTIADEPDNRPMKTKYTIAVHTLESPELTTAKTVHGLTLVTDHNQWPEFTYGDPVIVTGKLEKPTQIEDFHYDRYLSRYNIYSVIYRGTISPGAIGANFEKEMQHHRSLGIPLSPFSKFAPIARTLFSTLYSLKSHFEVQINRVYPEPHASFLAGLLTGSRRGIPEYLLEDFHTTGLTHIIAISGYNITIVISLLSVLFFFLPYKYRLIPSIIAIALFTLFVGASAAVVRASIMGTLGLIALHAKRQGESILTILCAASIMTAWNPKQLWYDAGFQLSFLAITGLTIFGSHLQKWCSALRAPLWIRDALATTLAAQLFALPWIVFLFGRLPLLSPLANVLVAPFIPLAMLFGFLGTVISFFIFPLGQVIAYIGWGCLQLIILVAQGISAITPDTTLFGIHPVFVVLYYVALLVTTHTPILSSFLSLSALPTLRRVSSAERETY